MMLSSKLFLAFFGFILIAAVVFAEDPVDGEIKDEDEENVITEEGESSTLSSSDAQITFMFISPPDAEETLELVAGKVTKFLIGFANRGEKDFTVHFSHSSFRYPLDYNYHVQNFTLAQYKRVVAPKQEATFDFGLIPNEAFIGRPLGLVVNLHYSDADNVPYITTAFNQTVSILEDDSVFNAEYYMLIATGIGFVVVLLLIGQHFLSCYTRKTPQRSRAVAETGTGKDFDFEWIPKDLIEKKIIKSPKNSPRQRRVAKAN